MSKPSVSISPINRDIERISPELVQAAARYQAAILADVAGRRGTVHGRVRPLSPKMKVAFYVNGKPYTDTPRGITLTNLKEIAIVIGTPPETIPSKF